jgi:hypothetical protein
MQEAVPAGQGAMAALMPVSAADAEEVCRIAADKTRLVCKQVLRATPNTPSMLQSRLTASLSSRSS